MFTSAAQVNLNGGQTESLEGGADEEETQAAGEEAGASARAVDRSGMKETAGVMEVQLGGLKLDNVDCLEPLALHIEVRHAQLC